MHSVKRWTVVAASGLALAAGTGTADAKGPVKTPVKCSEKSGAVAPAGAKQLVELQPPSGGSLTLALDANANGDDSLTFTTKDGADIGTAATDATATITAFPHKGAHKLPAALSAAATPVLGGRGVRLDVCVTDKQSAAGTYTGTATIQGPHLSDLPYTFTITAKKPSSTPIIIIAVIIVVLLLSSLLRLPTALSARDDQGVQTAIGLALGGVASAVAAGAIYWSSYATNDTWGDDFGQQAIALGVTAATAGAAGAAAARAWWRNLGDEPAAGGGGG